MINAAAPQTTNNANYAYVANFRESKGEPRAKQLWPQVRPLYSQYVARLHQAGGPIRHGFPDVDNAVLRDNYDYLPHVYFDDLRADILQAAGGNCAYCNNSTANEIDHFLPKQHFGEYSVYGDNLTPICTPCNRKKLQRYIRVGGGRRYVHPYFDLLPATDAFVECAISVGKTVTTAFTIHPPPTISAGLAAILEQHFEDLGLSRMYKTEATKELMAKLGSLYSYFGKKRDQARVAEYLRLEGLSAAAASGRSHWRPVLLLAAANSPQLCDGGFMALGPDPLA